jgi:flagella basal body P-ring formation protein FlgA
MHIQLLSTLALAASHGSFQDLDALDARIAAAVGNSATAVAIDHRIKLATCPEEPQISSVVAGAVSVRCASLGWKIRVAVTGAAGTEPSSAPVVHRGDTIEVVAGGAGYSASSVGTALDEGTTGSQIRVKIPTSASPLSATVARAGVVTISN